MCLTDMVLEVSVSGGADDLHEAIECGDMTMWDLYIRDSI